MRAAFIELLFALPPLLSPFLLRSTRFAVFLRLFGREWGLLCRTVRMTIQHPSIGRPAHCIYFLLCPFQILPKVATNKKPPVLPWAALQNYLVLRCQPTRKAKRITPRSRVQMVCAYCSSSRCETLSLLGWGSGIVGGISSVTACDIHSSQSLIQS